MFTPRPGWGGKLRRWAQGNLYFILFRLIIVSIVVWVGSTIISSYKTAQSNIEPTPTPTDTQNNDAYPATAEAGWGLSDMAAAALNDYLTDHPTEKLSRVEHLWAVDRIWNTFIEVSNRPNPKLVHLHDSFVVPATVIEYAISEARHLSPSQRAHLSSYLK